MHRSALIGILVVGLALSCGAVAQGFQRNELSAQVSGLFTHSNNNTPTTHLATNSAGLLLGYRLHLNRWEAVEVEYGYTRNGQRYATTPGAPAGNFAITSNMQEAIANEVITTPRLFGILQPFVLGGGGVVVFTPRNTDPAFARTQTRGAWNYGAGVDFHIFQLGARLEYQGLIFKIPDYKNPLLRINKWTHVAQPSVGLILTF